MYNGYKMKSGIHKPCTNLLGNIDIISYIWHDFPDRRKAVLLQDGLGGCLPDRLISSGEAKFFNSPHGNKIMSEERMRYGVKFCVNTCLVQARI
jgi:hypothetical protein